MKRAFLASILLFFTPVVVRPTWGGDFPWPVIALTAATAADGASSIGGRELNPVYGQARLTTGRFVAVNAPLVAAYGAGWKLSKGKQRKWIAILGYAVAGIRIGVAVRNMRVQR